MNRIFVTGISTDVGKSICAAIICQALKADYWKPIQSGDLEYSDSQKIREWTNFKINIHPNAYTLKHPLSPHAAAMLENIEIEKKYIVEPKSTNDMVIEGAGGLLVPLNNDIKIIDLIKQEYKTIIVSRNYLGSINHTLLTIDALKQKNLKISGIIFNGTQNFQSEEIILRMSNLKKIGHIEQEAHWNHKTTIKYATQFKPNLLSL